MSLEERMLDSIVRLTEAITLLQVRVAKLEAEAKGKPPPPQPSGEIVLAVTQP